MNYPQTERAIEVIKKLLHPTEGCPWDLEQTHQSLLKYLIEESYEFVEAVEHNNSKMMEEELGDILLQVLLHSEIGKKKEAFDIESVAKSIADKMVRRHPHVFGNKKGISTEEIITNWKEIKDEEKKGQKKYSIDKKFLYAPALESAYQIGKKSTAVNFDWENHLQVISKVEEEWQEVKQELLPDGKFNHERVKEEIGDLLFSVAQLARHLNLKPEECLKDANKKFITRFQKIEDIILSEGGTLEETSQKRLEKLWTTVKKK